MMKTIEVKYTPHHCSDCGEQVDDSLACQCPSGVAANVDSILTTRTVAVIVASAASTTSWSAKRGGYRSGSYRLHIGAMRYLVAL